MQPDFQVESHSYDQVVRGSWHGYRLDAATKLSDEDLAEPSSDAIILASTLVYAQCVL